MDNLATVTTGPKGPVIQLRRGAKVRREVRAILARLKEENYDEDASFSPPEAQPYYKNVARLIVERILKGPVSTFALHDELGGPTTFEDAVELALNHLRVQR